MRRYWIGALFIVPMLALGAACGDDDDSGSDSDDRTPTRAAQQGGEPTRAPASDATRSGTAASGADGLAALRRAAQALEKTTYKAVYEISGNDPETGKIEGTMTMAAKPPRQLFGLSGNLGGEPGTLLLIDDGTNSFLCIEGDGEKSCLKSKSEGSSPVPLPELFSVDDLMEDISTDSNASVKEIKGQKIAGKDGKCFEVKSKEGNGSFCLAEDSGLLLFVDGEFDGSRVTLKAKELSNSPSDKDFEPPYPVVDLGR